MFKRSAVLVVVACVLSSAPAFAIPFFHTPMAKLESCFTSVAFRGARKKFRPGLERIRKRLIARHPVTFQQLRALADAGDSLAAFAFAKRLSAQGKPALISDELHYYSEAAIGGRKYAVRSILEIAARQDLRFNPAHLKQAERALNMLATNGNAAAADGLIQFYSSGHPFGAKPHDITRLLQRRVRKGDGDAAFRLAIAMLSSNPISPEGKAQVIRYLQIAAKKGSLGTQASAANIIISMRAEQPLITSEAKP
jgi:hypothetical protein